jgi:hypothetical protein
VRSGLAGEETAWRSASPATLLVPLNLADSAYFAANGARVTSGVKALPARRPYQENFERRA